MARAEGQWCNGRRFQKNTNKSFFFLYNIGKFTYYLLLQLSIQNWNDFGEAFCFHHKLTPWPGPARPTLKSDHFFFLNSNYLTTFSTFNISKSSQNWNVLTLAVWISKKNNDFFKNIKSSSTIICTCYVLKCSGYLSGSANVQFKTSKYRYIYRTGRSSLHFGYKTHAATTIHDTRLLLAALALGMPPVASTKPRKNTLLALYPPLDAQFWTILE